MTTRFKTGLAAALAMVTMAAAAPMVLADQDQPQRRQRAIAGGPGAPGGGMRGPGGPMGPGPVFRGLDLTDDQKAQLKSIADSRQNEFRAAQEKIAAAREGIRDLIEADTINEGAIRAKSAEVAAAEAELMILNAKLRKDSLQILTADQLAKLKEQRESRGQRQRRPQR
jgi:Spy/CpxP family protein refolding chaperone